MVKYYFFAFLIYCPSRIFVMSIVNANILYEDKMPNEGILMQMICFPIACFCLLKSFYQYLMSRLVKYNKF